MGRTLVEETLREIPSRWRPPRLIGDKAYDSDKLDRDLLERHGVEMIAPNRRNRNAITQDRRALRPCWLQMPSARRRGKTSHMIDLLRFVSGLATDLVRRHGELIAENALLRQQLIVAHRKVPGRVRWAVVCQNRSPRLDDGSAACEPWTAMSLALALWGALRAALRPRTDLALENLALRQQLALLRRRSKRPRFGRVDRAFWLWLSNRWSGWRQALHLVRPETVIRWHRQGFRAFWTWKSRRGRVGRPRVGSETAQLVRTMALANPPWGAPRIHGELLKLGLDISQCSVARLMPRRPRPPSQTWRTFLQNHLADLVSVDFFVVPTATFRVLYVFVVLLHRRRHSLQRD